MKRSTCASGSGYVPSNSAGFCVARTRNGRASSWVWTSTVTLRSCMHSSSPDWVFGDARLISSTSTTLAKTGPGRNSKRPSRWLKTLVPTRSAGSRSAVPCTRAKARSSERASARARVVLPTPGRSSMSTWPSASMATRTSSSTASLTSTARRTFPATRRMASAASSSSDRPTRSGTLTRPPRRADTRGRSTRSRPGAQLRHGVEHRAGDLGLGRQGHVAVTVGRDDRDLVGGDVEAGVLARDVVEHDRVETLVAQLAPRLLERVAPVLGGKADQRLAVAALACQPRQHVGCGLELDAQPLPPRLLELLGRRLRRAEVGDRGGHEQRVAVGEGLLARVLQLRGGLDVGVVDARVARQRDVGGDHPDGGAARGGLVGQREAHPPARAVADEAHGVERLARAARGDEDAHTLQRAVRGRHRLDRGEQLAGLGQAPGAPLAL